MKRFLTLTLLSLSVIAFSQVPQNAPWAKANLENDTRTLEEISAAAEAYFSTIDVNQKGSGYKPFKRWQYNWSKSLNADGTIRSKEDLWKAWNKKMQVTNSEADLSNWTALGPYENSNTYNANGGKQTGQGRVNVVAVDPSNSDTYYVGTPAGGIWKSTNAGLDWSPLTDELPQIGVSGIAIHPTNSNIIYIATGDDDAGDSSAVGVWKSEDGGATWANTGAIPGNPNSMNEIYVYPNSPDTVIVATSSGVMRSTNAGGIWTNVLNGNIRDLKMKPNDPTTWFAVTSGTFYRSTDSGATFTNVNLPGLTNSNRLTMGVTNANNAYVYVVSAANQAGYPFNGLYKSTNSGASFTKTNANTLFQGEGQAWYDFAMTVSSNNPEIVYVGVVNLHKSTNGGNSFTKINSWSNPNQGSFTHADIHYLNFIDGKFFAGTDGGIFVSTDEGVNFTDLTKNLAISQFYRISVSPQNYNSVVGGLQDNGGYGYNNGTWKNYHGADGMEGIVDPINPNKYYGFIQYGAQLHITENGGQSRTNVVNPPNGEVNDQNPNASGGAWITPMAINNLGELYAGYNKLYQLVNNNWVLVSTGGNGDFGGDMSTIEIDPNNVNNIYIARGGSLRKSIDKGVSFTNIPFTGGAINAIEVSSLDSNIVWVASNSGVYKSTNILDASPTFTNITGNLPFEESKLTIKHHKRSGNNTIYLGTSLGVWFINDDINLWEVFDNNLPNTQVRDLAINEEDSKLVAATFGRGAFISDIPRQLPPNDVRLLAVVNPSIGINCASDVTPEITVKNQGVNVINSITINYIIDGTNNTFNWNGNLGSEETINIALPQLSGLSLGTHTLNVETVIANDEFENNTINTNFSINNNSTTPLTVNTFESASDNLLVETTNLLMWERGRPNKTLLDAAEGDSAYITGRTNNHPDNTTGYLYTNCYDFTNIDSPELAFKMAFDIENEWDYMVVEYSTDSGANWDILGDATAANWYNSSAVTNSTNQATLPGKQWTGEGENVNPNDGMTNATIRDYSYNLAAFTNEANIVFRFKFVADANTNEEGAVIDNLVLNGVLATDSFNLLSNISIYPNPSESIFNIDRPDGDALNIKVYDITGKKIFEKKNITDTKYQLDLGSYAQGIYLLNLNMNGKTATKKLVLK